MEKHHASQDLNPHGCNAHGPLADPCLWLGYNRGGTERVSSLTRHCSRAHNGGGGAVMTTIATVTGVVIAIGVMMDITTSAVLGGIAAPNGGDGTVGSSVVACAGTVAN
jgi:hypothetical protein